MTNPRLDADKCAHAFTVWLLKHIAKSENRAQRGMASAGSVFRITNYEKDGKSALPRLKGEKDLPNFRIVCVR